MRSIVVGTDGSANAEAAVRRAVEILKGTEATVHLVAAYPGASSYGERLVGTARRERVDLRATAEAVLARAASCNGSSWAASRASSPTTHRAAC